MAVLTLPSKNTSACSCVLSTAIPLRASFPMSCACSPDGWHRPSVRTPSRSTKPSLMGSMGNLVPLRAYAISLTKAVDRAEDLVQDTVLRALSRQESFEKGTNQQAWLFTILRNSFFSDHRRAGREIEDADGRLAGEMATGADQESRLVLQELEAALAKLPREQREALLLVGMEGLSYEETAVALGCAVGTVKSRVNRARNRLAEILRLDADDLGGKRTGQP